MSTTEYDVRRLATALPEVTEKPSDGTPAYYVAGKSFARIHDVPGVLVCRRENLADRDALLRSEPRKYFTTEHYRGHPSVLVRLDRIDPTELYEILVEAWASRAPQRLRKGAGTGRY